VETRAPCMCFHSFNEFSKTCLSVSSVFLLSYRNTVLNQSVLCLVFFSRLSYLKGVLLKSKFDSESNFF